MKRMKITMPSELVVNIVPTSSRNSEGNFLMPPTKATPGSAAFDCRITEPVMFYNGQKHLLDLGFRIAIPEGYVGKLFVRSGLSRQGFTLANGVGIIDPDYRGTVMANMLYQGEAPVRTLAQGERVCQLIIEEIPLVSFRLVDDLGETTRTGGFGSTGRE